WSSRPTQSETRERGSRTSPRRRSTRPRRPIPTTPRSTWRRSSGWSCPAGGCGRRARRTSASSARRSARGTPSGSVSTTGRRGRAAAPEA
ncbi:MAG: hypothetical protein AVDCRST_MAG32-3143, partial [uncultured Nocardioides sp.]